MYKKNRSGTLARIAFRSLPTVRSQGFSGAKNPPKLIPASLTTLLKISNMHTDSKLGT